MISKTAVVLGALGLVVLVGLIGSMLAQKLRQPAVVGEIVFGLLLGPFVAYLSRSWPDVHAVALPSLSALANVGLVLFIFMVGIGADHSYIKSEHRVAGGVALGGVALPFAAAVSIVVLTGESENAASAVFVGIALAVTAFPVLARILESEGLTDSLEGQLSMAAAAITDVTLWVMLTVLVAVNSRTTWWLILLMIPFVALLFGVARPAVARILRSRSLDGWTLAVLIVGLLLSAAFTDVIGMHSVIGAFLFGAAMPRQELEQLRHTLQQYVMPLTGALLLPVFFILAGSQVDLSVFELASVPTFVILLVSAILTKVVGAYCGGRLAGLANNQAGTVAVLMNARGLTELIVLDVGRQLGLLDKEMYTALVIVAIVTTSLTRPGLALLDALHRRSLASRLADRTQQLAKARLTREDATLDGSRPHSAGTDRPRHLGSCDD